MVKYELSEKLVRNTRSENHNKIGNSAKCPKMCIIRALSCVHLITILTASCISKNNVIQIPNIHIIFNNVLI